MNMLAESIPPIPRPDAPPPVPPPPDTQPKPMDIPPTDIPSPAPQSVLGYAFISV
jgi:hypothetical protein